MRLYVVSESSDTDDIEARLDRIAGLGFGGAVLAADVPDVEEVASWIACCRRAGLQAWIDVDPQRWALIHFPATAVARTHYPADAIDPRAAPRELSRFEGNEGQLVQSLVSSLRPLLDAGLDGLRCVGLGATPAWVWEALLSDARRAQPGLTTLAWTIGAAPDVLSHLEDVGFDAAAGSLAWWDFRADWFVAEEERLRRIAPRLIAALDAPDGDLARVAAEHRSAAANRLASVVGAIADGLVVGPAGWHLEGVDTTPVLSALNARLAAELSRPRQWDLLTPPDAALTVFRIRQAGTPARLLVVNPSASVAASDPSPGWITATGCARWSRVTDGGPPVGALTGLAMGPAETLELHADPLPAVRPIAGRNLSRAAACPRLAIESIRPAVDDGRFAAKRCLGDFVRVEADIFSDGHDQLAAVVLYRACDETAWQERRMRPLGNDRWAAEWPLERIGRHLFTVEAWHDEFATFRSGLQKKIEAGVDVALEVREGVQLLGAWMESTADAEAAAALANLLTQLKLSPLAEQIATLLAAETAVLAARVDPRRFRWRCPTLYPIEVEREAARFAAWYELFPRSQSGDGVRHGTFDDVIAQLPRIAAMGFDVLYLTPIHPIGRRHRKGRNNSLQAEDGDPGSPYAIGADEGGHDAIHPELGTREDFQRLREAASTHGLELALDFAIQCAPDHPWVRQHPEWFAHRPDGSIRYAENPPKKYEDIVNVDFYADGAVPSLWRALRDAVRFWVQQGVAIFRVDNPHTKPLPFWEWLIADIRATAPEVIFLSEAFTRPRPLERLAKLGFSQSYTYFTWRTTKRELTDYLEELNRAPVSEFLRPHFFVNTPDINPFFLQRSGRAAFLIRAALAATLSGLWGMYNGFELAEAAALPGKEEYLDSEKYQLRAWDWQRPGHITAEIALLNRIRRRNPALRTHLGVRFQQAGNDQILCYTKATAARENVVLAFVCLDPFGKQSADYELPLWEWGLPDDGALVAEDLITGERRILRGKHQRIELDPAVLPYALWRLVPESRS